MLQQEEVEADTERLRAVLAQLPDAARAEYYRRVKKLLRDPDTYAVLNYMLVLGLHHFYLGNYLLGGIEQLLFFFSLALFLVSPIFAVILLAAISAFELWTLIRSQVIVQDFNNRIGWQLYQEICSTSLRAS